MKHLFLFLLVVLSCRAPHKSTIWNSQLDRNMIENTVRLVQVCPSGIQGLGTGFIVSPSEVETAKHVTVCRAEGVDAMFIVRLHNDVTYKGVVVGKSEDHDVARIKLVALVNNGADFLDKREGYPTLEEKDIHLTHSTRHAKRTPKLGETLCLVGGSGDSSVRVIKCGKVTRTKDNLFIVSIRAVPGNSGGPVFDSRGNVLGVLSMAARDKEHIAYVVPSKYCDFKNTITP